MITDPLRAGPVHAARKRLSRGFSHRSSPHTSPLFSSVGAMPAIGSQGEAPSAHFGKVGFRVSLTLSHGAP